MNQMNRLTIQQHRLGSFLPLKDRNPEPPKLLVFWILLGDV